MATRRKTWAALVLAGGLVAPHGAQPMDLRRSTFAGAGRAGDRTMDAVTIVGDHIAAISRAGAVDLWHGFLGPLGLPAAGGVATIPGGVVLAPISPNPAGSGVSIRFRVDEGEPVTISVYDLGGRRVRRFADQPSAREGAIHWNLHGDDGARLPSGLYFVRLESDHLVAARPVMLID